MQPLLTLTSLVSTHDVVEPRPCNVPVSRSATSRTRRTLLSRVARACKGLAASRRHPRLHGWEMADFRTQDRDPLGELTRHLTLPPLGF